MRTAAIVMLDQSTVECARFAPSSARYKLLAANLIARRSRCGRTLVARHLLWCAAHIGAGVGACLLRAAAYCALLLAFRAGEHSASTADARSKKQRASETPVGTRVLQVDQAESGGAVGEVERWRVDYFCCLPLGAMSS